MASCLFHDVSPSFPTWKPASPRPHHLLGVSHLVFVFVCVCAFVTFWMCVFLMSGRVGCPNPGADGLLMLNGNYLSALSLCVSVCLQLPWCFTTRPFTVQCCITVCFKVVNSGMEVVWFGVFSKHPSSVESNRGASLVMLSKETRDKTAVFVRLSHEDSECTFSTSWLHSISYPCGCPAESFCLPRGLSTCWCQKWALVSAALSSDGGEHRFAF